MKSMTGYGKGQAVAGDTLVSVEITSVNHRQMDVRLDLPSNLNFMEDEVRRLLRTKIARGALICRVATVSGDAGAAMPLLPDEKAVARSLAQVRRLARRLDLPDDLRASHLLTLPGIWKTASPESITILTTALRRALRQALTALERMRRTEGLALAGDLRARLRKVAGWTGRMEKLAPRVSARARRRLLDKIKGLNLKGVSLAAERLEREAATAVMRGDITEELTRLKSHLTQAEHCLAARKPAGRKLDFLLQEMFREVNTVGAKAGDVGIARLVVQCKTELERVREQAQNLE